MTKLELLNSIYNELGGIYNEDDIEKIKEVAHECRARLRILRKKMLDDHRKLSGLGNQIVNIASEVS